MFVAAYISGRNRQDNVLGIRTKDLNAESAETQRATEKEVNLG